MKKLIMTVLCVLLIAAAFAGCGGASSGESNIEGSLEELMEKLYANVDESVQLPFVGNIELSEDMAFPESGIVYYIGAKGIPFTEGIASEAVIGAIPHSLVLLRMADNADIAAAKERIRTSVDPMKWICAGVTREEVIVDSIGNLLFMVLSNDGPALHDAFKKLAD